MPHVRIADSLSEFLNRVSEIEHVLQNSQRVRRDTDVCELWFRGSEDADYLLEPSLYRGFKDTRNALDEEDELRLQFQRQGRQMLGTQQQPQTEWEWYFLMRHHGAPTRLLDWTDGALIALYFAITDFRGCGDNGKDKAVWAIDPQWLNGETLNNSSVMLPEWAEIATYLPPRFEAEVLAEYPAAVDPPHIAPRVGVQRSRFTIHGTRADGLEAISAKAGTESRLFKIVIPKEAVQGIKEQLARCGITRTTVFPDLDALGSDLSADLAKLTVRGGNKSK